MDKTEEVKESLIGKFKKSDESVKLAVVVAAGVAVGVTATLAVQAYGRKRENDAALRLQAPQSHRSNVMDTPRVTVLRLPAQQ